jgi:hypothetical protein
MFSSFLQTVLSLLWVELSDMNPQIRVHGSTCEVDPDLN